jgi:hypothetical protein
MNVGRRGDTGRVRHEFANTFDIQHMFGRQQMPERISHSVLTFLSGQLQNLHVHFVGHFFCMSGSQRVPRHAKTTGRKHLLAVSVVGEGSRFSNERIDDVTIIDGSQLLADQSRHGLNNVSVMSHRDLFGPDAQVNELADQPTGNRVRVGSHGDRAAARDSHALDDVVRVEPFIGQSIQMSQVIQEVLPPVAIGPFHQVFHEGHVFFAAVKTSTATQQQRLIDTILEMAVGRFDVAVFVGTASIGAFRFAVVVTHQSRIPFGEFATTGVISHGRGQRITAMPFGHAAEFPERFLNTRTERFKRLRKAQRYAFDIAVRQHAVEERVLETLPGDLHPQCVADGEVTGRQSPRMMFLTEENRPARAMQTSPSGDASLERSTSGIREPAFVSDLQPFK